MKKFSAGYRYLHANGTEYAGTIEADTPEELKEHMQAEIDASEGAMDPGAFTVDANEAEEELAPRLAELIAWPEKICTMCLRPLSETEVKK